MATRDSVIDVLKTIEIGGTKGKVLTRQIRDIFEEFSAALASGE